MDKVIEGLKTFNLHEYKYIYVYSDLREFGRNILSKEDKYKFLNTLLNELLHTGSTIVIPSFTYTTSGIFQVNSTKTHLGAFNNFIQQDIRSVRSEHPLFSFSAIGPNAEFLKLIGNCSFGNDSVFSRLIGKGTTFLNIGRPISSGNTLVHYVEDENNAYYRFHKTFNTEVYRGDTYCGTNYSAFLRRRDVSGRTFETEFRLATDALYSKRKVASFGDPESYLGIFQYEYDDTLDILMELFKSNHEAFI